MSAEGRGGVPSGVRHLGARMGEELLKKRLELEKRHGAREHFQGEGFLYLMDYLSLDRVVEVAARWTGLYGMGYRQYRDVRVVEHEAVLEKLPEGLDGVRLLQLSDLHSDLDPTLIPVIQERLRGLEYDLVVITGDFRDCSHGGASASIHYTLEVLKELDQSKPVFAVLGNHDGVGMVPPLEEAGVRFLMNEHECLEFNGAELFLVGVDDPDYYECDDLERAMKGMPSGAFSVLLSHTPENYREAVQHGVSLMLAGHTHGGQICLPGGVAVLVAKGIPRRLVKGAWREGEMLGYTSPGTGACSVPLRFNCPPEITLHTLRPPNPPRATGP